MTSDGLKWFHFYCTIRGTLQITVYLAFTYKGPVTEVKLNIHKGIISVRSHKI